MDRESGPDGVGGGICHTFSAGVATTIDLRWYNTVFSELFRVGSSTTIDSVVDATTKLQEKGWGAIIVLQRDTGLKNIKEAGTHVKAEISSPLLVSIFNPGSPLHDGAVIIQNNIIEAAQCILPLTESEMIDPEMGTRHRAALGISEETDVIAIVVSEEKKQIAVAVNGVFQLNLDELSLKGFLNENLFSAQASD
jgi:diadenylate cyclase